MVEDISTKTLKFTLPWEKLREDKAILKILETEILPGYLMKCRWFAGKARKLISVSMGSIFTLTAAASTTDRDSAQAKIFHLLILKTKYKTGKLEQYLLPLASTTPDEFQQLNPKGLIAPTNINGVDEILFDAIYDDQFRSFLFKNIFLSSKIKSQKGTLIFEKGKGFNITDDKESVNSRVLDVEQSNSSIIYEEKYFLKIYRKLFPETNPDVEIVSFLTEKAGFTHIPSYAGRVSWKKSYHPSITLAMMQEKVSNVKDVWSLAGDYLNEYLFGIVNGNAVISQFVMDQFELLGTRTGEMHLALGSDSQDESFAPEPFTNRYQQWLFDHFESLVDRRLKLTKENYSALDETGKQLAGYFIDKSKLILDFFSEIKKRKPESMRIRIHGDYHLGQVLYDGKDYIILDFEGEPESSIKDRKIKHSPLKDVAGMLRSFHYAVSAKLYFSDETKGLDPEIIENAAQIWYKVVSASYLTGYLNVFNESPVIGKNRDEHDFLLKVHLLEKAIYELGYELNSRPTWVKIPLKGIEQVVKEID